LGDPIVVFLILGGLFVLGIVFIFTIIPFLGQAVLFMEVGSILSEALGSYFGRPGLVQIGCLMLIMVLLACCCGVAVLGAATVSCFTEAPASICRLIRP
jgi:hypothetical protein